MKEIELNDIEMKFLYDNIDKAIQESLQAIEYSREHEIISKIMKSKEVKDIF